MARAIDSEAAYRFLSEQLVKETGAFSKGVNKGLNIARSAMRNPDAIPTLHPVSREQVEKVWRGCRSCKGCRSCVYSIHDLKDMPCKKCDPNAEGIVTEYKPSNFCPVCGKPLTDEAVQMVMGRLEQIKCKN